MGMGNWEWGMGNGELVIGYWLLVIGYWGCPERSVVSQRSRRVKGLLVIGGRASGYVFPGRAWEQD